VKLIVTHDEYGNIKSAAIVENRPELRAALRPRHGESITEVEASDSDIAEFRRNPFGVIENSRLDAGNARLLPKYR
jgi:hypothetical protein